MKIVVSDTGMGIPEHVKNDLFRIDKDISRQGTRGEKGTGLGLILCKEFLEKHGQELFIDSEEGKGTSFSFYLPIA